MADTIQAVYATQLWQDVATLTDGQIADGEGCTIQNQSGSNLPISVAMAPTMPSEDFGGWLVPAILSQPLVVPTPESGSKVWVKCSPSSVTTLISIQKL